SIHCFKHAFHATLAAEVHAGKRHLGFGLDRGGRGHESEYAEDESLHDLEFLLDGLHQIERKGILKTINIRSGSS
ncbi:uncharacterized protein METZ01_LOCUS312383, partial [marine metagenome]